MIVGSFATQGSSHWWNPTEQKENGGLSPTSWEHALPASTENGKRRQLACSCRFRVCLQDAAPVCCHRHRWLYKLDPGVIKTPFSEEDSLMFERLLAEHGTA
jgi:hypothetical protein